MNLTYVPALKIQRELYTLPRGMERFWAYIHTMTDADTGDLALPLVAMNPMGKDHLPRFLDALLVMDADAAGVAATTDAALALGDEEGEYKVLLVVSDDAKGGWTNRFASEFGYRFEQRPMYRRGFIVALLWTSEEYTPARIREEVLMCIYRAAYVRRNGFASTLGEMIAQEREAMRRAGVTEPAIDADDLEYTRDVLAPLMPKTDRATLMAAMFGDPAARELGYDPLGLSPRAGLALARQLQM